MRTRIRIFRHAPLRQRPFSRRVLTRSCKSELQARAPTSRPSSTSFISRSSLLICSRLPAAAAARTSSLRPSGSFTHNVRTAEHPPPSEARHHELLVGLGATGHARRHQGELLHLLRPQLDRLGPPRLAWVGQAERVARPDATHPTDRRSRTVRHPGHAAHVGVVLGQVGKVEPVGPNHVGWHREGRRGDCGGEVGGAGMRRTLATTRLCRTQPFLERTPTRSPAPPRWPAAAPGRSGPPPTAPRTRRRRAARTARPPWRTGGGRPRPHHTLGQVGPLHGDPVRNRAWNVVKRS